MKNDLPVITAISGASGVLYGLKIIEYLLLNNYKVEVIISKNAYCIFDFETDLKLVHDKQNIKQNILNYLNLKNKEKILKIWLSDDFSAAPSSGSYKTAGMIIAPASMSTLAATASGFSHNLITRCTDVSLKEGRKIVVVPRETPLSSIHLENMLKLSKSGVKIVPPCVGFYSKPESADDCINFVTGIQFLSGIT